MTSAFKFSLCFGIFLAAARGNVSNANDAEACTKLCESCNGESIFDNGICNCTVSETDTEGLECVKRLQQEADDLNPDSSIDQPEIAERTARCSLYGSRRRKGLSACSHADRIVSYFLNDGPLSGSTMFDNPNVACSTSSDEPTYGLVNLKNMEVFPIQPEMEIPIDVAEPVRTNCGSTASSYSSSNRYQPIAMNSWVPNYSATYGPITIGASQPFRTTWYPRPMAPVHQTSMAFSNAVSRPVSQVSNAPPRRLGAQQHVHGTGSHSGYTSQHYHPYSNVLTAPFPVVQTEPRGINTELLSNVLAHDNAILEWLSSRLTSSNPHIEASRMNNEQPMSYYPPQSRNQNYPDSSTMLGLNNPLESTSIPFSSPSPHAQTLISPKTTSSSQVREHKNTIDNEIKSGVVKKYLKDEKTTDKVRKPENEEKPRSRQQPRPRFPNGNKRETD